MPTELPELNPQVTRFAVGLAVVVHLFSIAAVIVAAWIDAADFFQAVMVWGLNLVVTTIQILGVLSGHWFSGKGRSVSRTKEPIGFWLSYWICIFILLVIDVLLVLGYIGYKGC